MISSEFPPDCGGIGSYTFYLSRELIRMGHCVSVILRGKENRNYTYENITIREIKVPGRPPFNLPIFKKKLEKILSKEKTDLVHIHSTSMPPISCNCPVIVTAHWCIKEGTPIFYRPVKDLDALYRNILLPFYINIERKLVQSCDKLTVVSRSQFDEFKKHYNVKAEVIYNAVDTDLFSNNGSIKKDDAILFTGRLCMGKGILELLYIAQMLKRSHPNVTIYLVGDGPFKKYFYSHIKKRVLSNVKLIAHVSHFEIIDFYKRSRIYVLPTYYEGLPTTILEAMACKIPVVATNVSGIPEQIDDGTTGYMLPQGDVNGFYDRVVELLDDPAKQEKFGNMGRKKIIEKFTWTHITPGIIEIYKKCLS